MGVDRKLCKAYAHAGIVRWKVKVVIKGYKISHGFSEFKFRVKDEARANDFLHLTAPSWADVLIDTAFRAGNIWQGVGNVSSNKEPNVVPTPKQGRLTSRQDRRKSKKGEIHINVQLVRWIYGKEGLRFDSQVSSSAGFVINVGAVFIQEEGLLQVSNVQQRIWRSWALPLALGFGRVFSHRPAGSQEVEESGSV